MQNNKDVAHKSSSFYRFPDQTKFLGQITCGAIVNPEKPSLGNAAVRERAASAEKSKSAEESNLKAAEDKSAKTAEAEIGAELGERKKQETTEEVKKPAAKSLSHPDAPVSLAPKSIILSAEKNKQKKYINVYVRKYINVYTRRNGQKRGKLIDQGGPSTAPEENMQQDHAVNVEPEENMQQDHHVDVSQAQNPAEVSNGNATMVKKRKAVEKWKAGDVDAGRGSKRVRNRALPFAVVKLNEVLSSDQKEAVVGMNSIALQDSPGDFSTVLIMFPYLMHTYLFCHVNWSGAIPQRTKYGYCRRREAYGY